MQKAIQLSKPGKKICEIAAEIMKIQAINGTFTGIPPMISVNDRSGHMNWNQSTLNNGDFVRIELSGAHSYYNCPISRTITLLGTPICIAARPIPGAAYIVSNISSISFFSESPTVSTVFDICLNSLIV